MDIREAIEKAGHEGRGKLDDGWRFEVNHGVVTFFIGEQQAYSLPPSLFTDNGWQVVEPEQIEVGDTIRPLDSFKEHKVIHIHRGVVWTVGPSGNCYQDDINRLTLIRKGNRHVFEGVKIIRHCDTNPHTYYPTQSGYPWDTQMLKDFHMSQAGKKTYRMELTEVVE